MALTRCLIISLGNPAPYTETLHSAGHLALAALQKQFPSDYPPFTLKEYGRTKVNASEGRKYTLLQSPTLMNVSGPWVQRVWKEAARTHDPAQVGLIIVHDDLEVDLGIIKIRDWTRSGRGHNGIKSIKANLSPFQGSKWRRISVGIGRPEERDQGSVSRYVLGRMPRNAKQAIDAAASQISDAIVEIEQGWMASSPSTKAPPAAAKPATATH